MRAFTIPSIFTAIDKFSAPVKNMGRNVEAFAAKAEAGIARGERMFRKLTPSLSGAAKEFLSFASAAAIATGIVAGATFSVKSLQDYETALASFRTIVSDATDQEFAAYQNQINQVAKATKKSSIDVAASFEKIAGLNAEFAKTAEGLGSVSSAAITLAKASGADLGQSAENLVGIMNQFSLGAKEADRAINVLAAGQAVGAANISQTSEAFKNFGSVAAGANITLEESVGLVQTLGKFSVFGAEAGTKLRGSVLKLQKAGVGYASGQFNINDALAEAKKRIDSLKTSKEKDAALTKMFGAENISTGRILLANIELFKKYTAGVTGTSEAQKAADINSQTLTAALGELKAAWVNIITSSNEAGSALNTVKRVIKFLTEHLDTIVSIGTKVLLFFAAWKTALILAKVFLVGYNIALGITGALSGVASIAIGKSAIALGAYKAVVAIVTAAQWLWNAALLANPIGLIILAIAALIAIIVVIIKKYNEWGAALALVMGPLGMIINLVQSFRRNWDMITKSFKEGGILAGLKAIGKTILDAVLMPIQQVVSIIADLTGAEWAQNAVKSIEAFRKDLGVNVETDESGNPLPATRAVNPKAEEQSAIEKITQMIQKQNVAIDIKDQTGRASVNSDNNLVPVKLSTTMGF